MFFRPPSKVGPAKNIYNKSERLSVVEGLELDLKGLILKSTKDDTAEEKKETEAT
jgi:hypothetical protein